MENVITNNTFTSNENIENTTLNTNELLEKDAYNQLTTWEKFKYRVDQILAVLYIIRCVCCFTSIFSIIGTMVLICNGNPTIAGLMFAIGLPSAILACPFRFIGIGVALTVGGFSIGLCFLGFGCLIGAAIGFLLAVVLFLYFPAFVTIPYFFNELHK